MTRSVNNLVLSITNCVLFASFCALLFFSIIDVAPEAFKTLEVLSYVSLGLFITSLVFKVYIILHSRKSSPASSKNNTGA